jgi:hypothetical protein
MFRLLTGVFLALLPSGWAQAPAAPEAQKAPGEGDLPALIERLSADDRRRLLDYLRLDLSAGGAFQLQLIAHAQGFLEADPGFLPDAPAPVWFDPLEHAPAQPIPRRLLAPDSPKARALQTALERRNPPRRLTSGYAYDWGSERVVRLPGWDDARRELHNAAQGFAPDLDLAEAIALAALDDGRERRTLAVFEHRYTDRDGNVYPGVSLFTAWGSGLEIEMPDVDTLGILHSLFEKYPRAWKAPVPGSEHKAFYAKLEGVYLPAKRHRALCEALARSYLSPAPELWFGFTPAHHLPLQSFWEQRRSDLGQVAEALPDSAGWEAFLSDLTRRTNKDAQIHQLAINRRAGLEAGEAHVRRRLLVLALDLDLFERYPASGPAPSGD